MPGQVINGKAYELVVANALAEKSGCQVVDSPETQLAKKCMEALSPSVLSSFRETALSAASIIAVRESLMPNGTGNIRLQPDSAGISGDVRDLVLTTSGRAIGISCKTNHSDLKHSRLSGRLNFIRDWGIDSAGCSQEYFSEVTPVFDMLRSLRISSNKTATWASMSDVPGEVYWPILDAWKSELERALGPAGSEHSKRCGSFVRYLFGNSDFYKVIGKHGRNPEVTIQAINFNRTLNGPKSPLPSQLIGIDRRNGGQYSQTVRMDKGYTFNFRIHSASSKIEPSLKFAVSALSMPTERIFQQTIS